MGKRDISRDMGGFPNERLMAVRRGGAKSLSVSQQKISGHKSTTRLLLYRKVRARQRDLIHRSSSSFLVGKPRLCGLGQLTEFLGFVLVYLGFRSCHYTGRQRDCASFVK